MSVLLDTHVLLWLIDGDERLGQQSKQLVESALHDSLVFTSAITFWEIALLRDRGRISLSSPVETWRQNVLNSGVVEIPVSGDIGIAAVNLRNFHRDPADRIITATTLIYSAQLITADAAILSWSGDLDRHNASI